MKPAPRPLRELDLDHQSESAEWSIRGRPGRAGGGEVRPDRDARHCHRPGSHPHPRITSSRCIRPVQSRSGTADEMAAVPPWVCSLREVVLFGHYSRSDSHDSDSNAPELARFGPKCARNRPPLTTLNRVFPENSAFLTPPATPPFWGERRSALEIPLFLTFRWASDDRFGYFCPGFPALPCGHP